MPKIYRVPYVKKKPRARNRDGTWRKKRSDAGKKREKTMSEGKNEALDHVEECLDMLRTGIMVGLHPIEATLGTAGLQSQVEVTENVKADFKKLSEAIKALRKEQHEQEDQEERPS